MGEVRCDRCDDLNKERARSVSREKQPKGLFTFLVNRSLVKRLGRFVRSFNRCRCPGARQCVCVCVCVCVEIAREGRDDERSDLIAKRRKPTRDVPKRSGSGVVEETKYLDA